VSLQVRKSTGFLGMMKDKSEADVARIKATLMLTYGYVTFYAPPALITSRIEVNILATIMPHFGHVRDHAVKENLIRCVELIGAWLLGFDCVAAWLWQCLGVVWQCLGVSMQSHALTTFTCLYRM
jgi:hypothetical protein